jgi:hypothetical protein
MPTDLDIDYNERTVVHAGQPSAGQGVTVAVPGSERQRLLSVAFRLVTSAVVATRTPVVTITDGTGFAIGGTVSGFGLTASSTADFLFSVGNSEWDQSNNAVASGGIASVDLMAGDSIVISVGAIDAGDQISRIRVTLAQLTVRDVN